MNIITAMLPIPLLRMSVLSLQRKQSSRRSLLSLLGLSSGPGRRERERERQLDGLHHQLEEILLSGHICSHASVLKQ